MIIKRSWNNEYLNQAFDTSRATVLISYEANSLLVKNLKLILGENFLGHRKRIQGKHWTSISDNIARICPSCGVAHLIGFYQALEKALGLDHLIPDAGKFFRILFLEWSKIEVYLKYLLRVLLNSGAEKLANQMRSFLDLHYNFPRIVTGIAKFNPASIITLCGVKIQPSFTVVWDLFEWDSSFSKKFALLEHKIKNTIHLSSTKLLHIPITKEFINLHPVGTVARAIGLPIDLRLEDPMNGYEQLEIKSLVQKRHDFTLFDIFTHYFSEIQLSVNIMGQIINKLPLENPLTNIAPIDLVNEPTEGWSRIEGPFGEINYYIKLGQELRVEDFTWTSPSLVNWSGFCEYAKNKSLKTFPVLFDIFNFCFKCAED